MKMDKKKALLYGRRALFLVVLAVLLVYTGAVLERKTVTGAWNYSLKVGGFKNEPEESFDVIGIGSSHMYCTLNPLAMYDETGLRGYVLATQQQPPVASYYYAKEAFRTQSPDVLIVEGLMFTLSQDTVAEGVAHDAVDPFPNTINKLLMIHRMDTADGKENYYLNFLKYHSRWKELTAADFDFSYKQETDPYRGYVFLTKAGESSFATIRYDNTEPAELKDENLQILLDMKELAEKNGARFLILMAPCTMDEAQQSRFYALHAFAQENGIELLDLNVAQEGLELDALTDFYDAGHLNVSGAEKVSAFLGEYLLEQGLAQTNELDDTHLWEEDLAIYYAAKEQ